MNVVNNLVEHTLSQLLLDNGNAEYSKDTFSLMMNSDEFNNLKTLILTSPEVDNLFDDK
jgi:hypothetical protein